MQFTTKNIAVSGIVASLYVVLSLVTFPIASGSIQLRLSEGLTLLPLIFPQAIVGLLIGCALSNLITGCMLLDVVLGSLITLVAGILTFIVGKIIKKTAVKIMVGGLFPVLLNALFLPLIWVKCYGTIEYIYPVQALILLVSQALSVYAFGSPVLAVIKKRIK